MKQFVRALKLVTSVLLVTVAVALYWLWRPLEGTVNQLQLQKGAAAFNAEIIRDRWGVPTIVGDTNADTSFGLAYAHAEDDFYTIQEAVAATRGVLARYRGKSAAPTDYLVQLMDVWGTVDRGYEGLSEESKTIAEAYAAGLNLYAADHAGEVWQGLTPFTAQDVVAGFVFKTPLFYGLDKPLLDLFDEDTELELALAPAGDDLAWSLVDRGSSERGSNAIAVAAKRSPDQTTRLLINSHQPMTGPVAWYEAQLHARQGWRIHGGVFPGTPVILHGFTPSLGWASTVNHIDLWDEYLLTVNPENQNQYLLDGEWLDFETRDVTILVKLWSEFRFPVTRTVLRSRHGPVIRSGDHTYAIRYAGMSEVGQLSQYIALNKATNFDQFSQAMAMQKLPSINFVYADKDSNISFMHNARYPQRPDIDINWQKGLPGDRGDLIWQGIRPFSQTPILTNPESGLLFNANNTPFSATDGDDNLKADDFPESMGLATNQTNRSWRLIELNDGASRLGEAELLAQKFDVEYSTQSSAYQTLQIILDQDWGDSSQLSQAQSLIKQWDRKANIENKFAALPISILRELHRMGDPKGEELANLRPAAKQAVAYLMRNYGRLDPQWGEVNRLVRGSFDQPLHGGPDVLRAIYSQGHAESEKAYATAGDTWMALVAWDQNGFSNAKVLHQFGSATVDESSPHFADQAPLFVRQQWREASFDIDRIRADAVTTKRVPSENSVSK